MKKALLVFLLLLSLSIQAAEERIIVNNRILAKVNDKTISVLDVMKKMNVFLSQNFPQYVNSPQARYQFYSTQWREVLRQMIDQELMIADAEKSEIKISDADIREKLQEKFGPNVVSNLEKIGISYDEAKEMVKSDLTVQRMSWYRINSKALLAINPKDIKSAYKDYCHTNVAQDEWKYQSLSIRSSDPQKVEEFSEKAMDIINHGKAGLAAVAEELKQLQDLPEDVSIALSQEYSVTDKELNESHKNVLASLEPGAYSNPIEQKGRDNLPVKRIFELKDHIKHELPAFNDMSMKLEDKLIQKKMDEETTAYIKKLRYRFNYDDKQIDALPDNFQPFILDMGH